MYKSKSISSRHSDRTSSRYSTANILLSDDEYKNDQAVIYSDDSKFARQLKKLMRDEEDDKKLQKLSDLSVYLDGQENIKFVLKLARSSLNIMLKILCEQHVSELKVLVAECLGKIGYIMLYDREQQFFDWCFDKVTMHAPNDMREIKQLEVKSYIIDALGEICKEERMRYLKDYIHIILNSLKKLLENTDSAELMMKVTKLIILISNSYPDAVSQIFMDVVDILVAWHIDINQSSEVISFTSKSLTDLRHCWLKNIDFTFTLLDHFIEDLESEMNACFDKVEQESSTTLNEELFDNYNKIEKMSALIKVYTTVIRSISCLNDNRYLPLGATLSDLNRDRLFESFKRLINCVYSLSDSKFCEVAFESGNQCVEMFYDIFGDYLINIYDLLNKYLLKQNIIKQSWSFDKDISFLTILSKLINLFIAKSDVQFFKSLTNTETRLWNAKFSQNSIIIQEALNIYKSLIVLKSIPIVQEIYKSVLIDCELSYNIILKASNANEQCVLQENIGKQKIEFGGIKEAETCFIFNLCILAELGNAKNNLVSMYALSPSLFELLTVKLKPSNPSVADAFPNIQYAILNTLYSHCSKHDHFILNSSLFANKTTSDSTLFTNTQTRDYFQKIIELLTQLLSNSSCSYDTSLLTFNWLLEIIDKLLVDHVFALKTPVFTKLYDCVITTAYSDEENVCLLCNKIILKSLQKFIKLNDSVLIRILDLCKYMMMNINENIHEKYVKLLCYIPVNILTSQNLDLSVLTPNDFCVFSRSARVNYINTNVDGSAFNIHHFKAVMGYLLAGTLQSGLYSKTWLERLFYSCQRNDKLKTTPKNEITLDGVVDSHEGLLWFWALWESAQFCVQSKLKTPLGKPQDTFITIEGAIKSYYNLSLNIEANESNESNKTNTTKDNEWSHDLSRVTLLVQFLEYLEKIIYNAYEGTAVSIPQPTQKAIKTFFRTNKSTCIEWFSRVRFYIVHICIKSGHYEIAIRQSYEYMNYAIQHNQTSTPEFDQVILYLVKSLIKLRNWSTCIGLYIYLNQTLKRRYNWIKTAAEEAQRKLENACNEYKRHIKSCLNVGDQTQEQIEKPINPNSLIRFFNERIFDCYYQLHDWKEYTAWYDEYKSITQNDDSKQLIDSKIDIEYIRTLNAFETHDMDAYKVHSRKMKCANIQSLDELMMNISCKFDVEELETAVNKEIFKSVLSKRTYILSLDMAQKLSSTILRTLNMDEMSNWNSDRAVLAQLSYICQNEQFDLPFIKSIKFDANKHSAKAMNHLLFVVKNQQLKVDLSNSTSVHDKELFNDYRLAIARLARKQTNFNLANRLIQNLISNNIKYGAVKQQENSSLYETVKSFMDQQNKGVNRLLTMEIESESAKLIKVIEKGDSLSSIEILMKSVSTYVASHLVAQPSTIQPYAQQQQQPFSLNTQPVQNILQANLNEQMNERCARSILTLYNWLSSNQNLLKEINSIVSLNAGDNLLNDKRSAISKELRTMISLKNLSPSASFSQNSNVIADHEMILGELLDLSTIISPQSAKNWFTLANWCYKWGKKNIDKARSASSIISQDEQFLLASILPQDMPTEERDYALKILSKTNPNNALNTDEEDIDQSLYGDCVELTRCMLLTNCRSLSLECVENLIDQWKIIVYRVYYYHKIACKSYFNYLKLSGESDENNCEEGNISATLRIIKLLVKHAKELKDDLQDGLAQTPTQPWKGIIPQLFCRLNHPEVYVRRSISQLLCRVARDFPHLIVYPAVVGATDGPHKIESMQTKNEKTLFERSTSRQAYDEQNAEQEAEPEELEEKEEEDDEEDDEANADEEENIEEQKKTELQNSYKHLLDTLSETNNKMINEIKLFLHEMRRITLLREELWLGTLNQIHSDVHKRMEQLSTEISKVNSNASLNEDDKASIIKEKYEIILAPIVSVLEHVYAITKLAAETPNEENFLNEFSSQIEEALKQLKNISNAYTPLNGWNLFKQLHHLLYQRSQRRNMNVLSMEQISPKLSSIKSSTIPIPGKDGQFCTIYSIGSTIHILPTKTKPKKLFFIGSNGKRYQYLFKGLEDLHLDERIMQLLSIVNTMFVKTNKSEYPNYHALHYSVTPLGPRSGLISWVEGCTPLFSLYKRWQQREIAYIQSKQAPLTGPGNVQQPAQNVQQPLRPNEIYNNKLNAVLKEKGIAKTTTGNRNDYPLSVLRQVLEELIKETPNDLLSKELWCSAATPGSWWNTQLVYSRSTAVMSVIGYIIGLGDRHLDNLLVNLQTGEVAHIDYNICFEKGKNLRIPEKVPFRMTQNLRTTLGLTGIEGMFRLSCEYVLKTLRRGRETLLTLLEAFVYDPLLDWTGNDTGIIASFYGGGNFDIQTTQNKETKRNLDKNITYRLFAIRLKENKTLAQKNSERFSQLLLRVEGKFNSLVELVGKQRFKDELINLYEKAKLYLEESQKDKNHLIYTLHDRFDECMQFKENLDKIKLIAQDLCTGYESWTQNHINCIEYIKSNEFYLKIDEFSKIQYKQDIPAYFKTVEFLQSSGQSQNITQCESYENDLVKYDDTLADILTNIYDLFKLYSIVLNWLPKDFYKTSKHYNWLCWITELKNSDYSKEKCVETITYFQQTFNDELSLSKIMSSSDLELNNENLVIQKMLLMHNEISLSEAKLNMLKSRKENDFSGKINIDFKLLFDYIEACDNDERKIVAVNGVSCVLMKLLFDDLCKWNIMENASLQAKQQLVSLTSKDGYWFLEEMLSLISHCNHISNLMGNVYKLNGNFMHMTTYLQCVDAMQYITNVFLYLKELLFTYQQNLFTHFIRYSTSRDPDFLFCLAQLQSLKFDDFFYLIGRYNFDENILLDTECSKTLNEIKFKYLELINNKTNPVCVFLFEFDRLFTKIDNEFEKCIKFLKNYQYLFSDSLTENMMSNNFSDLTYLLDDRIYGLYKNIFLVKRYQTIYLCLSVCDQYGQYCFDSSSASIYNQDQFLLHLKTYISEYIIQMLVGIPTITINYLLSNLKDSNFTEDLTSVAVITTYINNKICRNEVIEDDLQNINEILVGIDEAWSRLDLNSRIDSNINYYESYLQTIQIVTNSYEWLYDSFISKHIKTDSYRQKLLKNTDKIQQTLKSTDQSTQSTLEKLNNCEQTIMKRLEWASGTMPTLQDTIKLFELQRKHRNDLFKNKKQFFDHLEASFSSFMQFEMLRTKTKLSTNMQSKFEEFLNSISQAGLLTYDNKSEINDIEINLMNFKYFKEKKPVTVSTIQEYLKLLNEEIVQMKRTKSKEDKECVVKFEDINSFVTEFKAVLNQHNKVMLDIKPLLKAINRCGDNDRLQNYTALYHEFSENCQLLLKSMTSEEHLHSKLCEVNAALIQLKQLVPRIFSDLDNICLDSIKSGNQKDENMKKEHYSTSNKTHSKSGKAIQECNSYAIGVWRRVNQKLDGKDPDPNKCLTVEEQIDFCINEAVDLNNLATLYEGWTPWV